MGLFEENTARLSEPEHELWISLSKKERNEEARRMEIHAAMVDRMDQNIGRLMAKLKEIEKFDNTLIFFLLIMEPVMRDLKGAKNENAKWGSVGSFEAIGQSWANAINSPFRKWKVQGMEGGICTP